GQWCYQPTGIRGMERRSCGPWRACGREQRGDIAGSAAACVSVVQQGQHRHPFVDEEANVALWFGECEGTFQCREGRGKLPLSMEGERMQHKDLQHTAHACFGLSICQETVQQVRGILKERSRRVSSSLGDAYPDQRQVLPLIRVAQFVIGGGESTCICPAYGGFQV